MGGRPPLLVGQSIFHLALYFFQFDIEGRRYSCQFSEKIDKNLEDNLDKEDYDQRRGQE